MRRIIVLIFVLTSNSLFAQVRAPEIDFNLSLIKVFNENNLLIQETRIEIDYEAGVYTKLYYEMKGSSVNYTGKQVFNYDNEKNVTKLQYLEGSNSSGDYSFFFYDNNNKLIKEEKYWAGGDLAGPVIYSYDDNGNQISADYYYKDGDKYEESFASEIMEYDESGYIIKMTSSQYGDLEKIIEFDYTDDYKLVEISIFNSKGEKIGTDLETYLINGEKEKRVQSVGTAEEITVSFLYNQEDRIIGRIAVNAAEEQLQRIEYQY